MMPVTSLIAGLVEQYLPDGLATRCGDEPEGGDEQELLPHGRTRVLEPAECDARPVEQVQQRLRHILRVRRVGAKEKEAVSALLPYEAGALEMGADQCARGKHVARRDRAPDPLADVDAVEQWHDGGARMAVNGHLTRGLVEVVALDAEKHDVRDGRLGESSDRRGRPADDPLARGVQGEPTFLQVSEVVAPRDEVHRPRGVAPFRDCGRDPPAEVAADAADAEDHQMRNAVTGRHRPPVTEMRCELAEQGFESPNRTRTQMAPYRADATTSLGELHRKTRQGIELRHSSAV